MAFGIAAGGGLGLRLGGVAPKLEIGLLGKPMLLYSLEAFQAAEVIEGLVLVVPPGRLEAWTPDRAWGLGFDKLVAVVPGGETRQESVYNALLEVPPSAEIVVVHDCARPLVTPDDISAVCGPPPGTDGLVTAVKVTDTIKSVRSGFVEGTLDREGLFAVQTPQGFRAGVLRAAHRRARRDGFIGTDDASLVERIGGKVGIVRGRRENMKVTFPEDVSLAEALLSSRRAP